MAVKQNKKKKQGGGRPQHPQAAPGGKKGGGSSASEASAPEATSPGSTTRTGRRRDVAPVAVGAVAPAAAVEHLRRAKGGQATNGHAGGAEVRVHGEAEHILAEMRRGEFVADHPVPDHVHEPVQTFMRRYVFSTDHKIIGLQFMFTSFAFMVVAGILALIVRWQIGYPGEPMPGGGFFPPELAYNGAVTQNLYNQAFTMHASLMIFFVIIPMLVGAFGNFLIPLQIGARDMAFPFLNALSYWLALIAGAIMSLGFVMPEGAAASGWTSYPPISLINAPLGQVCWLISVFILGLSSIAGAVNYLTTMINMRTPGMTMMRMPLTCWSLFITSALILFATPVLGSAMLMTLSDALLGTSFFVPDYAVVGGSVQNVLQTHTGGGQPLLFQHLFWFYSHPAVYIMILPAMGLVSEILAVFTRKPIFGYKMMVFAIAGIAFLGFIVWGHHMFVSGMNPYLGTTFMVSTMLIAVPSAIKTFNWLGTLWGGSIRFTTPMLNALAFVSMFVIGGLSGIFMASTPVDIQIHDTYFIVGHIHYVLFGGSLFGIFAGVYHWFPKMFGRKMNETLGKAHFWLTFVTFNCTFFPMHILGTGGMMRRIPNPLVYEHLQPIQWINTFVTVSALALGIAQFILVFNFFGSLFARRKSIYGLRYVGDVVTAAFVALLAGGAVDAIARGASGLGSIAEESWFWQHFATIFPFYARPDVAAPVVLAAFAMGLVGLQAARGLTFKAMAVVIVGIGALPLAKIFDVYVMKEMFDGVAWAERILQGGGLQTGEGLFPFPWLYSLWSVALTFLLVFGFAAWAAMADLELGAEAGDNPWEATTLEWVATTSPPWYANFTELPRVHHGPHEYNVPGVAQDWLPQNVSYKEAIAASKG